jgi:hypothetical protein
VKYLANKGHPVEREQTTDRDQGVDPNQEGLISPYEDPHKKG